LNQSDLYQAFRDLDRMPGIMEPRIGRWRAWPMAKMQLFWHLMYPQNTSGTSRDASFVPALAHRLARVGRDAAVALRQSRRLRECPPAAGTIGMMYVPRVHRCPDGRVRDMIYGDLLCGHALALPTIALEQPWPHRVKHRSSAAPIHLDPYQSATEVLALALMASPRLRRAADDLDRILAGAPLPIPARHRHRKMLLGLAMFEARRRIFRRLWKRLGVRCLAVTYGPGRIGEIAAARDMGIPVVEFQHGVMSAGCPDYGWPPEYRALKCDMAVPDCIALFGSAFTRELVRAGFWDENEAIPVGAAAMEHYRSAAAAQSGASESKRLLFMTQANTRDAALSFWREFAQAPDETLAPSPAPWTVVIKPHPEESTSIEPYRQLATDFPDRVALLPSDTNPIEAMINAGVVVAYNSLALVEALGLGRPAVSLCGGTVPAGLAGALGMSGVVAAVPHISSPQELRQLLLERGTGAALDRWREQARSDGHAFYSDGFTRSAAALINGFIHSGRQQARPVIH
jgi:hypothetical protein